MERTGEKVIQERRGNGGERRAEERIEDGVGDERRQEVLSQG